MFQNNESVIVTVRFRGGSHKTETKTFARSQKVLDAVKK
jgi:hypothetical protein